MLIQSPKSGPTIFLPQPPPTPRSTDSAASEPQDTVQLSSAAMAYVDPDEAWKSGSQIGTAVGGTLGTVAGAAGAAATGQPEAAVLTGPVGLAVGSGLGYYAGGAVAAGAAHMSNAVEGAFRWVFGR